MRPHPSASMHSPAVVGRWSDKMPTGRQDAEPKVNIHDQARPDIPNRQSRAG